MTATPAGLTPAEVELRSELRDTAHDLTLSDTERLALAALVDELEAYRKRDPFRALRRFTAALAETRLDGRDEPVALEDQPDEGPLIHQARRVLELEIAELILDEQVDLAATSRSAPLDHLTAALERLTNLEQRAVATDELADAHKAAAEAEADLVRIARDLDHRERAYNELAVVADRVRNAAQTVTPGYLEPEPLRPLVAALEALDAVRRA